MNTRSKNQDWLKIFAVLIPPLTLVEQMIWVFHKVWLSDKKKTYFALNCNISWFLNGESGFLLLKKGLNNYCHDKKISVFRIVKSRLWPLKNLWFWWFFAFCLKTREIFVNKFSIYYGTWLEQFVQYFQGGHL